MDQKNQYVQLAVRADTLQRLLANQALHVDEVHCHNRKSTVLLKRLLLNVLLCDGKRLS